MTQVTAPRRRPDALPRFLTPSGGVVHIDAPGYDLGDPWFCSFQVRVERPYAGTAPELVNRHLDVAPVGNCALMLERALRGRWVQELDAAGGRVMIAEGGADDTGLVAWQGRWHEVFTSINPTGMTGAQALRPLDRLTFDDSPSGVRVTPGQVPVEVIVGEQVRKRIPGVGFLHIVRGETGAGLVPKWSGATTRSGEVWRKETTTAGGARRSVLIHASASAVTILSGDVGQKDHEEPRLEFLDRLNELTWQN